MADFYLQPNRLLQFALALKHAPWPVLETQYRDVIDLLRSSKKTAVLLGDVERKHYRFTSISYKFGKTAHSLPVYVKQWLASEPLNPLEIPPDVWRFFNQQKASPLDAAQRYIESAHALADVVYEMQNALAEIDANLALGLAVQESPSHISGVEAAKEPLSGPGLPDSGAWELFARALASGHIEGKVFIGGDVSDAKAQKFERLIEQAVKASGAAIMWGEPRRGSWWRPFKTAAAKRLGEADLDTLKRAAEVQLLDRHESESAKSYAEAIAILATAVGGEQHAYLAAKNVILLKTIDAEGRSVTVSRVLTPREVSLYQTGELDVVLSEPTTALRFLRTGALPVSEVRSIEGEGSD